jgi:predicted nucleotidyltransferase
MTKTREAVLQQLEANREKIRSFGVKRLGLFGSCARGEVRDKSDLDFVVEFSQKSFDAYMDLEDFLEGLFGCPVDLVLSNTIKPRLRKPILSEAVYVQGL